MLRLDLGLRVFVGLEPVDMRGSFYALAGTARRLGLEPADGHLYLFFNRARSLCKGVWFDGSGWCLFSKRLERGSFALPKAAPDQRQVAVDALALAALLQGVTLGPKRPRWYRR